MYRCFVCLVGCLGVLLSGCQGSSSPTSVNLSQPEAAAVESMLIESIRQERSSRQLGALALDGGLAQVARAHSVWMRDNDQLGHLGAQGLGTVERVRAAGFTYSLLAENVGMSQRPEDLHPAFMGSAEHRVNILDPEFRELGVGVARGGNRYWVTQLFLRP
ncbi:MAG: hypothetical protein K0U98_17975 [Deltaproteobacteria bacterium]|nr:hypothetical protein [Deltaproteobacteria bacterium]